MEMSLTVIGSPLIKFSGTWVDDKANGLGIYYHNNGCKYEGEWKDDLQEGKGKESWPDGSYYEGNYSKGKKNGPGTKSNLIFTIRNLLLG